MKHSSEKVVIVGTGNVGSMTAYTLLNQGLCSQIVLIDRNQDKAMGEAMDMQHASHFMSRRVDVKSGDYSECSDADIVIITASAPMKKTDNDRMAFLGSSKAIMKSILTPIMDSGFNGILIIISNPVDVMAYYAWKLTGLPKNHVIGTGTTLDTIRLEYALGQAFGVDSKSVSSLIIGEHGRSSVPVFSTTNIGGVLLDDMMEKYQDELGGKTKQDILDYTISSGFEIVSHKGNTCYGIAASVSSIVKSIFFDERRVLPVTTFLDGEYGLKDVAVSLPCVIGADGIEKTIAPKLTKEEEEAFLTSCKTVASYYPSLDED
jgi:L-lactate dehydrogenase